MQYFYQRSQMGTSASCQGSKGADIRETCSCKQTSGLTLCRLLWPGRSSHGRCVSVRRSTRSQSSLRSYTELLYSHYSFMLHVILHGLLFINLYFQQLHCTIFQCGSSIYYRIHCVFDSSITRKCMRAVDEKQEINLLWPDN